MNIIREERGIKVAKGDIIKLLEDGDIQILAHQVNCKGVMGAGLAKQVRKLPYVFNQYKILCNNHKGNKSKELLGAMQIVKASNNPRREVANLFGQDSYGRSGKYTDEQALKQAFISLSNYSRTHNLVVGIPLMIGAGLGGGDHNLIMDYIVELFDKDKVILVEY